MVRISLGCSLCKLSHSEMVLPPPWSAVCYSPKIAELAMSCSQGSSVPSAPAQAGSAAAEVGAQGKEESKR